MDDIINDHWNSFIYFKCKKVKLNRPEVPLVKKRDYIFNPKLDVILYNMSRLIILTL